MQKMLRISIGCIGLIIIGSLVGRASEDNASDLKIKMLSQYEDATNLSQELNLLEDDPLQIKPKLRHASELLLQEDWKQVRPLLQEILNDLRLQERQRPFLSQKHFRAEWLEMIFELIQKLIWLALLAYAAMRSSRFRRIVTESSSGSEWFLSAKLVLLCLVMGSYHLLVDFSKYGQSSWAFFDIHLTLILFLLWVLPLSWGIGGTLCFSLCRYWISGNLGMSFFLILATGVWVLIAKKLMKKKLLGLKDSFIVGAGAGLIHGLFFYAPMREWMSLQYWSLSLLTLSAIEGFGSVAIFYVLSRMDQECKRQAQEKELLKTRLLFLQAQMNPHFVFNSLSTISAVCDQEKAEKSKHLVLQLSNFLRQMARRDQDFVSLRDEISYVDAYLELEKVRLGDQLEIVRNYKVSEENWNQKIPVLLIQPLVENAVKHGIRKQSDTGRLTLTLEPCGPGIQVVIEDNGAGMEPARVDSILRGDKQVSEGAGIGLRNLRERLRKIYGKAFDLDIKSQVCVGTKISLQLSALGG